MGGTKTERLEEDLDAMYRLPGTSFEPRRMETRRANSVSLERFDANDYSMPIAFARDEVIVSGGIGWISISSGPELVEVSEGRRVGCKRIPEQVDDRGF